MVFRSKNHAIMRNRSEKGVQEAVEVMRTAVITEMAIYLNK